MTAKLSEIIQVQKSIKTKSNLNEKILRKQYLPVNLIKKLLSNHFVKDSDC